jgi:sterol desaturase/sphingolipid hydroxylase (fatty acid hydroxylase superfamily)
MNWLAEIGGIWMTGAWWWIGFCAAFLVLTRFCPCNPGRNWWHDRRAAVTDILYWLVMPLVGQLGRAVLLLLGVVLLYGTNGAPPEFALRHWPLWCQCVAILLLQDVMMYWIHRIFHTKPLWNFHAVHHSSETLDWTSAVRFHPVNSIAEFAFADAAILLMGFSPIALAVLGPINLIYSVMVHANLNWTFGPLRYVFASPVFHRWHHTTEEEGLDRNFAPTFPFLDLMFGTFFMPARTPEVYGTNSGPLPTGFLGQMAYPFRKPVPAIAGLVAAALLGWFGYAQYTRPLQTSDVAEELAQHPSAAPALLQLSQRFPTSATSVAADAAGGRLVFGASDGRVTIRDAETGADREAGRHNARVNVVAVSPKGALAVSAAGDGTAQVIRMSDGAVLRRLEHDGRNLTAAAVSEDGWIAVATVDGTIRLWDAHGSEPKTGILPSGSIQTIALSEGGRRVVAAQQSTVRVWDVPSGAITALEGPRNLAYCVAIRADGNAIVAGDYEGRLFLWQGGETDSRTVLAAHSGPVYSVAFNAAGNSIVSGGADKSVKVWKPNGLVEKAFDGHPGLIFSVSYDGQRQRVLAAGRDMQATGWNLADDGIVPAGAKARVP